MQQQLLKDFARHIGAASAYDGLSLAPRGLKIEVSGDSTIILEFLEHTDNLGTLMITHISRIPANERCMIIEKALEEVGLQLTKIDYGLQIAFHGDDKLLVVARIQDPGVQQVIAAVENLIKFRSRLN